MEQQRSVCLNFICLALRIGRLSDSIFMYSWSVSKIVRRLHSFVTAFVCRRGHFLIAIFAQRSLFLQQCQLQVVLNERISFCYGMFINNCYEMDSRKSQEQFTL